MLRSVAWNYREGGVRQVVARAAGRASQLVYRAYSIDLYRCTELVQGGDLPAGTSVREIDFRELVQGAHFKALAYPDAIRHRFDAGERCFAVYIDDRFAHASWLTLGYLPIDRGIPDVVDDAMAGVYDCYTHPSFRGRGCLKHALRSICEQASAAGLTRAVAAIDPGNRASIAGFEKVGFSRIGPLRYAKVLGRVRYEHPAI